MLPYPLLHWFSQKQSLPYMSVSGGKSWIIVRVKGYSRVTLQHSHIYNFLNVETNIFKAYKRVRFDAGLFINHRLQSTMPYI